MKLLKDITTIFIILFTSIIAFGAIVVLFKAIFGSMSNLFVCIGGECGVFSWKVDC